MLQSVSEQATLVLWVCTCNYNHAYTYKKKEKIETLGKRNYQLRRAIVYIKTSTQNVSDTGTKIFR